MRESHFPSALIPPPASTASTTDQLKTKAPTGFMSPSIRTPDRNITSSSAKRRVGSGTMESRASLRVFGASGVVVAAD